MTKPTKTHLLIGASFAAAFLLPFLIGHFLPKTPPPTTKPKLAMRIEEQGSRVLLAWDRQGDAISGAQIGLLNIQEQGKPARQIALTQRELRTGSILYRPEGDDVSFDMVIFRDGGKSAISEVLRLIAAPRGAPPKSETQTTAFQRVEQVKPAPAPAPFRILAPPQIQQKKVFRPPKLAIRPGQQVASIEPPEATGDEPIPGTTIDWQSPTPPDYVSPIHISRPGNLDTFIPPRPKIQVMPNLGLLPVRQEKQARVVVTVDEKGVVLNAQPDGKKLDVFTQEAVLVAARQWVFYPATLRGKPIRYVHSILFHIQPKQ